MTCDIRHESAGEGQTEEVRHVEEDVRLRSLLLSTVALPNPDVLVERALFEIGGKTWKQAG